MERHGFVEHGGSGCPRKGAADGVGLNKERDQRQMS